MAAPGHITLTLTTENDDVALVSVAATATLSELAAAVEAHTGVPVAAQRLLHDGKPLPQGAGRLDAAGVRDGDLLMVLRAAPGARSGGGGGGGAASQAQAMARGADGAALNPEAFQALVRANPQMVPDPQLRSALLSSVAEMQRILRAEHSQRTEAEQRRLALANADPFDLEAQRKIEEEITRENVQANLDQALEQAPEMVVGSVFMLYVPCEANGVAIKAFVDSGAQMTIMTSACARQCGVMRLLDTRYAGIARGVGEQKILGRVHALSIKLGAAFLPCSVSVMEQDHGPSFILGLDMLRRHRCCIDLAADCLAVGTTGERVPFLPESELPRGSGPFGREEPPEEAAPGAAASAAEAAIPNAAAAGPGASPGVQQLVALGFPEAAAAEALAACGGNVEEAASLLFSGTF